VAPVTYTDGDIGTIVAHGDQSGGYALYIVEGGLPLLMHNDGRGNLATITGPALSDGNHELRADFDCIGNNTWKMTLTVDGTTIDDSAEVPMLYGMAPFEGITVGRDPRSPVWWDRFLTHGSFAYTGEQGPVTYTPGDAPPGTPPDLVSILKKMGAKFE
jgi:arylsulfatase